MPKLPRTLAVVLACALLALAGCGDDGNATVATPTPEDTGGEQGTGCPEVAQPAPKTVELPKPRGQLDAARTYVATVVTSCGEFEITLDPAQAPLTGRSFKYMADKGFYDGTTFHRIVPGFVIQGGDPQGTGRGGPGYSVVEPPPRGVQYTRGVVAMAKTELEAPGTSGSQFFVVTGEAPAFDPVYALVGEVTSGQEVVDRIGVVPVDARGGPADPIVFERVRVEVS
jgi:peptidyl-prolyl cis-trans isomerase B (cyclophilin B)